MFPPVLAGWQAYKHPLAALYTASVSLADLYTVSLASARPLASAGSYTVSDPPVSADPLSVEYTRRFHLVLPEYTGRDVHDV